MNWQSSSVNPPTRSRADQPGDRDLRRIARAADHRFAEKGAAEREAVEPADQRLAVPHLDRMREALCVERDEDLLDLPVDPGVGAILGAIRRTAG